MVLVSARTRIENAAFAGLRPDEILTVSEWADAHRILTSITSGEPGKWRTSRTPYLKEIMDRLSITDPFERVVVMKGAQIGATECGNNWLGYCIHHSPGPMLAVQPTVDMAKRWSKGRLAPLIESTPALRDLVSDPRARDSGNTVQSKEFPGGIVVITGANSAVGLRSIPVQRLFLDEIDAYPGDVDGEGDPVDLAFKRTSNFKARRKILLISTPTVKESSRIERAFLESDQRRFWVPCLYCKTFQTLEWKSVSWPEGEPQEAGYCCIECGAIIENFHKETMLAQGEWRPSAEGDGRTAGYHLSSLYSPHGWVSWGDIAEEFLKVKHDPPRLKVWVNTQLGQTWEERGQQVDAGSLASRTEDWGDLVPAEVRVLTAGVDVQDDRLEVEVVGWGFGMEAWSIAYHVIQSDPLDQQTWRDLDDILRRMWPRIKGAPMKISATCVDSGFRTQAVYDYTRVRRRWRCYAVKGMVGRRPIWDKKVRRSGKSKSRATFFLVGTDTAKDAIAGYLKVSTPGPGYWHFPEKRSQQIPDYFEQLAAEQRMRVKDRRGHKRWEWRKFSDSRRNEALDCRVYALAALHSLMVGGLRLNKLPQSMATPSQQAAQDQSSKSSDNKSSPTPPRPQNRSPWQSGNPKDRWGPRNSIWGDRRKNWWRL